MTKHVFLAAALILLLASSAWAFECPARIKDANAAIEAAKSSVPKISDPKAKGNAEGMLEAAKDMVKEAQKYHDQAVTKNAASDHYEAAAWAKAAKWLADQAKGGM
jgi:hypothetical protein